MIFIICFLIYQISDIKLTLKEFKHSERRFCKRYVVLVQLSLMSFAFY